MDNWMNYNEPPQVCVDMVGKKLRHKDYGVEVVVKSYGMCIDYLPGRLSGTYDVPIMNSPIIEFEVLSGAYRGKTFSMVAGLFLNFFALV